MNTTAIATDNAPREPAGFAAVERLLRTPEATLDRIISERNLSAHTTAMVLTILVAGAVFGATLGSYRGGIQIAYAAIKLPLLLLATAAICAPTLSAFNAALDRPSSIGRDVALVLSSLAAGALMLSGLAPIVLLAISLAAGYHWVVLLTVLCCAAAGAVSLSLLVRGMSRISPLRAGGAATALVLVFAMVGAQMSWALRPWVVRPRTRDVPVVRNIEGNILESIVCSFRSAQGDYGGACDRDARE